MEEQRPRTEMLLTPITDIYLNKTIKVQLQFLYKSTDLSRISSWGVGEEEEVGKGEKEMSGKPKHCHPYPPPPKCRSVRQVNQPTLSSGRAPLRSYYGKTVKAKVTVGS